MHVTSNTHETSTTAAESSGKNHNDGDLESKIHAMLEAMFAKYFQKIRPSDIVVQPNQERDDHNDPPPQLISEVPEASSWRDYVSHYWNIDPSRHQYRAGVDFTPDERKNYKARLSRMKLIAEFIRNRFQGYIDMFEASMKHTIQGKLTVNKICSAIRKENT